VEIRISRLRFERLMICREISGNINLFERSRMRFSSFFLRSAIICCLLFSQSQGTQWGQVQNDPGHTGYSSDQPQPPYNLLWSRDLGEPIATASQVIVAEGKVVTGTNHGNVYALDRAAGQTKWKYETAGPVMGSAAYQDGVFYVNSMDHYCHAINAASGEKIWKFETGEGIWGGPVIAEGKVFIGGRDGFVYAVDAESGKEVWKSQIGGLVMNTPAYADGTLYVAGGDMYVYAYDAKNGKRRWKSEKIPGAAMREYWLAAADDKVILTTQLVFACHTTQQMIQRNVLNPYNRSHKDDEVLRDHETFDELVEWFKEHPHHKTLMVLEAETGREAYVTPMITMNGGSCIGPMPAISPEGWAYTVYANMRLAASGWAFFGRINLETGKLEPLITDRYAPLAAYPNEHHWQPKKGTSFGRTSTWDGGFSVIDQSWGMSIGGDIALVVRDPGWPGNPPFPNYYVIPEREDNYLISNWRSERGKLSGINMGTLGGGQMHNTCSPMAVSGRDIFHKTSRSVIFAYRGSSMETK